MNKKQKQNNILKFRLLPFVAFFAVLLLTVRVNEIIGRVSDGKYIENSKVSLSKSSAIAKNDNEFDEYNQNISPSDVKLQTQQKKRKKRTQKTSNRKKKKNSNFTLSELDVLQNLAKRREDIEQRESEIDQKLALLRAAEAQINNKIEKLKRYENNIKKLMGQYSDKQDKKINSLVTLYTSMKPKDAARIFNELEMPILISLFEKMKPKKASSILAVMNSERAKSLTQELATRKTNLK